HDRRPRGRTLPKIFRGVFPRSRRHETGGDEVRRCDAARQGQTAPATHTWGKIRQETTPEIAARAPAGNRLECPAIACRGGDMPLSIQALLWGLLSGSALVVGATFAYVPHVSARMLASITAF